MMIETEKNICPCCGSNESVIIAGHSDSGWGGSLIIWDYGSVNLDLCVNCGCVYINKSMLQLIKEQIIKEQIIKEQIIRKQRGGRR